MDKKIEKFSNLEEVLERFERELIRDITEQIIEDRKASGLSQQKLARLAGVRQETISRLESGKHSPTVRTVEKIDRVLQAAKKKTKK